MQWGLCVAWFYIEVTSPKRVEFHLLVFCEMPAWMLIYYVGERALVSSLSSLEICELPCIVAFLAAWSAVFFTFDPLVGRYPFELDSHVWAFSFD